MKPVVFSKWRVIEPVVRSSTLEDPRVVLLAARRADAVGELGFRSPRDVGFHPFPVSRVVADVLAVSADGQHAFQYLHTPFQRALERGEPREPQREEANHNTAK